MPVLEPALMRTEMERRPDLLRKLAALRDRWWLVKLATGSALTAILALQILALAMFIDWWAELPWLVRLVSLLCQLAFLGFLLNRYLIQPWLHQPDDDELALIVERARPEFRSRLISSIQLSRGAGAGESSFALVEAARSEAEQMAASVDFVSLVPTRQMKKLGIAALVTLIVALSAFGYAGGTSFDLLKRVFLSTIPVPRKTRVIVHHGNHLVGIGDSVRLEAFAAGIVPRRGKVVIRAPGRRDQQFALAADPADRTHFLRVIENIQESFVYVVFLNDGRSPAYQVKAIPRPTVSAIECLQEFPPYTGLTPLRRPLGDLALLAGSRLKLQLTATKNISKGMIRLIGSNLPPAITLNANSNNRTKLTGEFSIPAAGLSGFSVLLTDDQGMDSNDSAVYRIEIVPDKVPLVRITAPTRKEELATREARLVLGMEIVDDFALSRITLRYKTATIEENALQTIELDLAQEQPRRLARQFVWDLSKFKPRLAEGSLVEFWIEAVDNNITTGPGIGASEHQVARVVSETEKRADLLNRAGDIFSSLSDAAADQEKLNRNLGDIILEKTGVR